MVKELLVATSSEEMRWSDDFFLFKWETENWILSKWDLVLKERLQSLKIIHVDLYVEVEPIQHTEGI